MKEIKLYVKTHNITGLKYLGKTASEDPHSYQGSGTRWRHHIKKHGYDVITEVIGRSTNPNDIKLLGTFWSRAWDVVESPDWANIKEETGDGGDMSMCKNWQAYIENVTKLDLNGISKAQRIARKAAVTRKIKSIDEKSGLKISKRRLDPGWKLTIGKAAIEKFKKSMTDDIVKRRNSQISQTKMSDEWKRNNTYMCSACKVSVIGKGNLTRWHNDNCKSISLC